MKNILEKLTNSIENLKSIKTSSNLYMNDMITAKKLNKHSSYASLNNEEKPLIMVDYYLFLFGMPSGILITDQHLYYKCMKKTAMFKDLTMPFNTTTGKIALEDINEIFIGNHLIGGMQPQYIGHELIINGYVLGYVRMGGGMTWSDELINNLNIIFKAFNRDE